MFYYICYLKNKYRELIKWQPIRYGQEKLIANYIQQCLKADFIVRNKLIFEIRCISCVQDHRPREQWMVRCISTQKLKILSPCLTTIRQRFYKIISLNSSSSNILAGIFVSPFLNDLWLLHRNSSFVPYTNSYTGMDSSPLHTVLNGSFLLTLCLVLWL